MIKEKFNSMAYGKASESDKEARLWLTKHQSKFGLFINGQWKSKAKAKTFATTSPATGEAIAKITQATASDVDDAVKAAESSLQEWQSMGGHQRSKCLYALARLLQKHARVISVLESMDNGKSIRESRDLDIPLAARHFYYHAGWAQLFEQEFKGYEPYGVVGQIIPWNFPLLMLAWKVAPALAAGNAIILKPAELTSLSALYFAELSQKAGIPAGVINIVTGDGSVGANIVEHPKIKKIAFTGSTDVGRIIRRATAGTGKGLTLELGGKSPFIIFEDADIDSAIEGVVDAIWFNQGQVCCGGSRLLVQEGIANKVFAKLKQRMQTLRVGDPLDKCIDMAAIVDQTQLERITKLVKQGAQEGATVWQPDISMPLKGSFYPPTLITDAGTSNVCMVEEIFGPVITAITFRTLKEAVALANNSRFGLAASVWSENINRALEVAPALKAGVVWINGTNFFDAAAGFGGYKESGFGREGGFEGMLSYVKPLFLRTLADTPKEIPSPKKSSSMDDASYSLDRTAKLYIGGKQCRADGGDSYDVFGSKGELIGQAALGNRKDIRNAVVAAEKATGWTHYSGHQRAQILYYIAENLSARAEEFITRLKVTSGVSANKAKTEFELGIKRLFSAAAWADKYEGTIHQPPLRGVVLSMKEAVGVLGIVSSESSSWLSFISLIAPAIAMGNRVVVVPSKSMPLVVTDFYQVLETSDLPDGVINIVTGDQNELTKVMARHNGIDGLWYFGSLQMSKEIEIQAAEDMKRTWVNYGKEYDWTDDAQAEGRNLLQKTVEIKNIWVPYGDQI